MDKKQYNKLYYQKNRTRILHCSYLNRQDDLRFCGACGRTIAFKNFDKHMLTRFHMKNEHDALFSVSDFPYRTDIYIKKLLI